VNGYSTVGVTRPVAGGGGGHGASTTGRYLVQRHVTPGGPLHSLGSAKTLIGAAVLHDCTLMAIMGFQGARDWAMNVDLTDGAFSLQYVYSSNFALFPQPLRTSFNILIFLYFTY
jgi:hypothetical protein